MGKKTHSIIGPGGPPAKPAKAAPAVTARTVDLPPLSLRAEIQADAADSESREVDLVFTTGAPVQRYDWSSGKSYMEELSLDPAHIRLGRLNGGAPLLNSHAAYSVEDVIGVVVRDSVTLTKREGRARVRFSKRDAVTPVWEDVQDRVLGSISVGYRIYRYEETEGKGNKLPTRLATDWEPFELSLVPIPADAAASIRGQKPADTNPCEIVPAQLSTRAAAPSVQKESKPMDPVTTDNANETRQEPEFLIEEPEPAAPVQRAAKPVQTEPTDADRAIARERERVQGIITACRAARLPQSFSDDLIAEGLTLVQAQSRVFAEMSARAREDEGPSRAPSGRIEVGDDPLVHKRTGIENAILHRVAPEHFKLTDEGRNYRGMSLLDIGRAYLHARGVRTSGMRHSDLAEAMLATRSGGMHSTSDFPSLLADVANKTLRAAYEAAPQTWRPLAKVSSTSDFKPMNFLQLGDAPELLEVLEHGEFKSGTITESKETIRLKTWGRIFAITRQALINDDLSAFAEIPAAFGRKAADKLSDLAWGIITANGATGDGNNLFSTQHVNYTSSGTAISVDSLGVARAALRKQKAPDGVTPLNLTPRYLIVPVGKETIADQYVSVITPAAASNANPFQPGGRTPLTIIAESRLDSNSATAWYMATDAAQLPLLNFLTLDGQEGPEVRQMEGFDVDGIKYRCRLDANFAAYDYRAGYKNAGQ